MNSEANEAVAAARIPNADPIREFYNSYPFPPPVENLERALDLYKDENVRRSKISNGRLTCTRTKMSAGLIFTSCGPTGNTVRISTC
jgi:hypothetical protein